MFAGKSTYLINTANDIIKTGIESKEILMINHSYDNRYTSNSNICTHDGVEMSSISLEYLNELLIDVKYIKTMENVNYIFIDEGQFFNDLYEVVKKLLTIYKKTIYICGLDGDYKQEQFVSSRIFDLIPYASTLTKLNSRCSICNNIAPFTKRRNNSNIQILIGGALEYKPVCLNHLYD